MTAALEEFVFIHVAPERKNSKAPTLRERAYDARAQERQIADNVTAAKACNDRCAQLVHHLELGVQSDLYIELDDDLASTLRELGDSVRIQYRLVSRQLEEARKLADECDEAASLFEAACSLKDQDAKVEQTGRIERCGEQLEEIQRYNAVLYRQLHRQHLDAIAVFDSLRR